MGVQHFNTFELVYKITCIYEGEYSNNNYTKEVGIIIDIDDEQNTYNYKVTGEYSTLEYLNSFVCPITHIYMTISTGGDTIWCTKFSFHITILTKFGDKVT